MASDKNQPPKPGFRKDGHPYKEGNTRADGSYENGKNRPSKVHQFKVGDDRKRGPRPRGSKNLATEWNEELNTKITIIEGGVKKTITKRRSLIKTQIDRGIKSSDRAAETAFRYAELGEKREPPIQQDDLAIIEACLASLANGDNSYDDDAARARALLDEEGDGDGVTGDA